MSELTGLEIAVLRSIFDETPLIRESLLDQLGRATVVSREHSAAGFFTTLYVPQDVPPIPDPPILGYETQAHIRGLTYPMGFVLFMKEGSLDLLEGYTTGVDVISDLDLAAAEFQIFREREKPPI